MAGSNIVTSGLAFGEGEALRVEDVMSVLHLSRNTVYKMAREGTLPSYRVGKQIRFRYEDVRAKLEGSSGNTAGLPTEASTGAHTGASTGASAVDLPRSPGLPDQLEQPGFPGSSGLPGSSSLPGSPDLPGVADVADPLPSWARGSLIVGGQSMAGDVLANYAASLGVKVLRSHANAYLSLARMYLETCHAAVVDLWSENDKSYNAPYLRRLLPGVPAIAFRLFKQRVGLTVRAGNPRGLATWSDLLEDGLSVAMRERGAGTRVLLDEKLKYLEARSDMLAGHERPVASELAQALLVARGLADVAVTSEKPSRQMKGLAFVPLQDETDDLVILNTPATAPLVKACRSLLRTDAFRQEFDPLLYDTRLMGEVVYEC